MDAVEVDRRIRSYFEELSDELKARLEQQYNTDAITCAVLQKCALERASTVQAWAEVALGVGDHNQYMLRTSVEAYSRGLWSPLMVKLDEPSKDKRKV